MKSYGEEFCTQRYHITEETRAAHCFLDNDFEGKI